MPAKERRLINLTPHTITLCTPDGHPLEHIESSGICRVRQVETRLRDMSYVLAYPFSLVKAGEVTGLPDPDQDGSSLFIVSRIAAEAIRPLGREDVCFPLGEVRDGDGRIVGVTGLGAVWDRNPWHIERDRPTGGDSA